MIISYIIILINGRSYERQIKSCNPLVVVTKQTLHIFMHYRGVRFQLDNKNVWPYVLVQSQYSPNSTSLNAILEFAIGAYRFGIHHSNERFASWIVLR